MRFQVTRIGLMVTGMESLVSHCPKGLGNVKDLTSEQKQTFLELSGGHAIRCMGYLTKRETTVARRPRNPNIYSFHFLQLEYEKDSKGEVKKNEGGDNMPQTVPLTLNVSTKYA